MAHHYTLAEGTSISLNASQNWSIAALGYGQWSQRMQLCVCVNTGMTIDFMHRTSS